MTYVDAKPKKTFKKKRAGTKNYLWDPKPVLSTGNTPKIKRIRNDDYITESFYFVIFSSILLDY